MGENGYDEMVQRVIEDNSYLALATAGDDPWVATIEYIGGEDGRFYFLSTEDSRHARHIEASGTAAVAIWDEEQPEYDPDVSTSLNGVQFRAEARKLSPDEYPDVLAGAVEALDPPMPPYAAYELVAERAYAPVIEDGVNERVEVELG